MIYITVNGSVRLDLGGFEDMKAALEVAAGLNLNAKIGFVVIEIVEVANPRPIGVLDCGCDS